jgi:polysaccharide export outer membrane protein
MTASAFDETASGKRRRRRTLPLAILAVLFLAACGPTYPELPPAPLFPTPLVSDYHIGPGDNLQIFVWRNPELSTGVPVRPDGRLSVPLIEDLPATGKTPTELARDIEETLGVYIQEPIVTVMVTGFVGPFTDQVRVIGEAAQPQALPYRDTMSLLDVMIAVGGITDFAAGNRAKLIRIVDGNQVVYGLRLDDLLKEGDMAANIQILPGDVVVIPEAWF